MSKLDEVQKLVVRLLNDHKAELIKIRDSLLKIESEIYKAPLTAAELEKKLVYMDENLPGMDWHDQANAVDVELKRIKALSNQDYLQAVSDYRAAQAKVFECEDAMTYVQRSFDLAKLEAKS